MGKIIRVFAIGVAMLALLATVIARGEAGAVHLRLDRSAPAPDTVVTAPLEEIRLWFSQEPQLAPTRIRLVGPDEALVGTADVQAEEEDASILFAAVEDDTPAGAYKVIWRTMAQDGHIVDGEFGFTVETPVGAAR